MSMIIQGRQLSDHDIASIRSLIAAHPDWHRSRLSIELCRLWNWRTDTDRLKDMACRSMLRKLEQRQLIVLPPSRLTVTRRRRLIRDVAHSTEAIQADLQALCPLEFVMVDGRNEAGELFHCLMDRYHYLGCRGHVGEHIKYMVCDRQKRPLACLLFGSAAWKTDARDRFIGWRPPVRQANLKLMTNNTRFLILPWVKVANLASFVLGACLRRLRADWREPTQPVIQWLNAEGTRCDDIAPLYDATMADTDAAFALLEDYLADRAGVVVFCADGARKYWSRFGKLARKLDLNAHLEVID